VAKDKIPTFSASYSAHLTDPAKAPYNFFAAADYSTQARAALKYARESWTRDRAPKLAFIYPDAPYGLAPLAAAEEYARELGFEIVGKEIVDLKAMDATTQLLRLQKKAPDFAWVGGTTPSTAVVMKDAQKLKMSLTFIVNIWGADENIFDLAGSAANGHVSIQAATVYGQPSAGMEVIEKLTKGEPQMTHFIRGFVSMLVMAEGLRTAEAGGELNGPGIKAALEELREYDPMGLCAPISFYPDDHRPNMAVNLYQLKDGDMLFLGTQVLERKKEWLGK
jgi:branched-chain amino acid transport system substrate-binding protein